MNGILDTESPVCFNENMTDSEINARWAERFRLASTTPDPDDEHEREPTAYERKLDELADALATGDERDDDESV